MVCNYSVVVTLLLCIASKTNAACVDQVNPQTGVSTCPSQVSLCTNPTYVSLMQQQCPKTCGFCTASSSTCVDQVNPQTGVSTCPSQASLCTNPTYVSLMQQQCPKTCGFCTASRASCPTGYTVLAGVAPVNSICPDGAINYNNAGTCCALAPATTGR